jgi:hypothetical protein
MNTSAVKNRTREIDYEKNLNKLIGRSDFVLKILNKSYGMLKGKLRVSPISWQKKIRKEWDTRLERQYKIASKKRTQLN